MFFDQTHLKFDPIKHKYFYKDKELISVSSLIHSFSNEFDEDGSILKKCAQREGITQVELAQRWENEKLKSIKKGLFFHKSIEYFIKTGKIKNNKVAPLIKLFNNKFKFKHKLYSETILYNTELGIAGTADLLEYDSKSNIINVNDFKTNKEIKTFAFGKRLKYPIDSIEDSVYTRYCMQISIYLYLLDLEGYYIGDNNSIFWINYKKNDIIKFPIEYRYKDVEKMIEFYKENKESFLIGKYPQNFKRAKKIDDWGLD